MRAGAAKLVRMPSKQAARKAEEPGATVKRPLRPGQCRAHMRKTLALEFEDIVQGFIAKAKSGSCPHVKLVTELLELQKRPTRARTGDRTLRKTLEAMRRVS